MTISEIFGAVGTVMGIIIGASSKYIGGLLNKKKDDTIRDFEMNLLKERYAELRKEVDQMSEKTDRIAVIEQRLKTLEHGQDKH